MAHVNFEGQISGTIVIIITLASYGKRALSGRRGIAQFGVFEFYSQNKIFVNRVLL